MSIEIRNESTSDIVAVKAPHVSHTEQFIINELRNAGQLSISLVAEETKFHPDGICFIRMFLLFLS